MRIVAAREVSELAPLDLPSLIIRERPMEDQLCRLLAVGDIGFSGRVGKTAETEGYDTILQEVAPLLRTGDIVFGNLEFPLTGALYPNAMFAAHPQTANALKNAGFTCVNLATNHAADYGSEGLRQTLNAVVSAQLTALGAGETFTEAKALVRTDAAGLRVGWLAAGRSRVEQEWNGPHYWEFNEEELTSAVRRERPNVDLLIVSLHLGLMYLDYPRPEHKRFVESLLREGAELVLMHHAHVLQGIQVSDNGRMVAYNLGNFVLDWREGNVEVPIMAKEQQEGGVFVFDLDRRGVARAAFLPTYTDERCCVRWAVGKRGEEILERLIQISKDLEGDYSPLFEKQRSERNTGPALDVLLFHLKRGNLAYVFNQLSHVRVEHVKMFARFVAARMLRRYDKHASRHAV